MNSEIIRTFITLSEEKSYVKAAYSLFVTQPTVTKRIKELESEMGKTLFNKNGNSISLTKEGVIFLDYALKYEELEKKVHSDFLATNIYTDTVNIGSTKCIYESHLRKPTLKLMNDKEKSLSVNVRLDHSKLLYSGLNNNIYDIIFSYVKPLDTSLTYRTFKEEEIIFVSSSRNLVHIEEIDIENLIKLPIIYSKFVSTPGFKFIDDLFPKNYRFKMNMSVISEIVYFLLNGTYYAFLPKGIIKNELENELLKKIKITDFTIPNLLSYATIKQKKNTWLLDYFCN